MIAHPSFDPARLHLRGGWAAAGPETMRKIIEMMGTRAICWAYGLSEASPNVVINDCRDPLELRIAGAGEAARRRRGAHRASATTAAALPAGDDRRDPGARLERDARLLQAARGDRQGVHRRRLAAHRRPRRADRRTAACASSVGSRTCFASAARTSRRPRSRRCCWRTPRSRPRRSSACPTHVSARCRAAFVTLKPGPRRRRELIDLVQASACANFRVPRYLRSRRRLRAHRHDRQRQGAEEQAARARDRSVSGSRTQSRSMHECRRGALRVLRPRRAAARARLRADRDQGALVERFAAIGFPRVEATSYSNPKVVPQFADASELLRQLPRRDGVHYKATCANVHAVERALADLDAGLRRQRDQPAGLGQSQSHSERNLKRIRDDQWKNMREMAAAAHGRFRLVGTISVAFGCPFEGAVDPDEVLRDVLRFGDARCRPRDARRYDRDGDARHRDVRCSAPCARSVPASTPIAHFHDTRGTGLVNYVAALRSGRDALRLRRSAASAGIRRR